MHRDRKLLDLAEGMPCVMCGNEDGTTVAAHSNLLEHGKGRGIKADDCMSAWLCYRCHTRLDQGGDMSKQERRDFTLTAICRTVQELFKRGFIGVIK